RRGKGLGCAERGVSASEVVEVVRGIARAEATDVAPVPDHLASLDWELCRKGLHPGRGEGTRIALRDHVVRRARYRLEDQQLDLMGSRIARRRERCDHFVDGN